MNNLLTQWADLAGTQLWQASVVGGVVVVLVRFLGRRPHFAFVLLLLAVCKFLTPPIWNSPISLFGSDWTAREVLSSLLPESSVQRTDTSTNAQGQIIAITSQTDAGVITYGRSGITERGRSRTHDLNPVHLLLLLWLCGAVMSAVFLGRKWHQHHQSIKKSCFLASRELQELCDRIANSFGIKRHVRLLITSRNDGPFCYGVLAPCIVLPQRLVRCTSKHGVELILTHELCHIWRYDALTALLQLLGGVVWWFHPIMWCVNRNLTRFSEQCCDLEVLRRCKCPPGEYAQAILDVLKMNRATAPPIFSAGIRPADVTKVRLELIMNVKPTAINPWHQWAVWALGMMLLGPGAVHQITAPSQLFAAERAPLDAQQKLYADSQDLSQAIAVLTKYLDQHGLSEYKHLFSEQSVAAGIENTLNSVVARSHRASVHFRGNR